MRFKMPEGHWQDKEIVGLAGPFFENHVPYSGVGAFNRIGDEYGKVNPDELVDWFVAMAKRKSG